MFEPMVFDTLSPEESCLSWGVAEHWEPYPLYLILLERHATWGDLTALPKVPAPLYQPINKQ